MTSLSTKKQTSNGMKFVFFGTSNFAIPILEALLSHNFVPSLIVTTPDKPAARGLKTTPSPVKRWAEVRAITLLQPKNLDDDLYKLQATNCKLFIVAAYGKIIPKKILEIPEKNALNVHPSLLPRWRGADPIRSAILAGDTETGITIMLMDEKMDHGPILTNSEWRITNSTTYEQLEKELAKLGGELLVETIPEWLEGKIQPREQDHSEATYTRKITKEDGHLNWDEDASVIERKIRALNPWPGTFSFWNGKQIKILEGEVGEVKPGMPAGAIFTYNSGIAVSCGKGSVLVKKLQLEGKKPVSAHDFLNGYPDFVGSSLT